jgi:hypothetical protein
MMLGHQIWVAHWATRINLISELWLHGVEQCYLFFPHPLAFIFQLLLVSFLHDGTIL